MDDVTSAMEPRLLPWAINKRKEAVPLAKGARATCSSCNGPLRAHCGDVVADHWHHESEKDCDPWHEPETEWHRKWKNEFDEDWCEITKGPHRADVITEKGLVIEFQHSSMSCADFSERENFWGGLVWVFDARDWFSNFDLQMLPWPKNFTFRWKQPRQSMFSIRRPLYLDTGSEIFQIAILGRNIPCHGSGRFIPYNYFTRSMLVADPAKAANVRIG